MPLSDHLREGFLGHVQTQPPGANNSSEEAEERDCRDELRLGAAAGSWKSSATIRNDRPFIATDARRSPVLLAGGLETQQLTTTPWTKAERPPSTSAPHGPRNPGAVRRVRTVKGTEEVGPSTEITHLEKSHRLRRVLRKVVGLLVELSVDVSKH